jgi:DNA-binding IclR family transcriptional regulator
MKVRLKLALTLLTRTSHLVNLKDICELTEAEEAELLPLLEELERRGLVVPHKDRYSGAKQYWVTRAFFDRNLKSG